MFKLPLLPSQNKNDEDSVLLKPSTSTSTSPAASSSQIHKHKIQNSNIRNYKVEYSKSYNAECCGCRNRIMKGLIRVTKQDYSTQVALLIGGGQPYQHHLECFGKICKEEYEFYLSGDQLPGFEDLKPDDQQVVLKHVIAGGENDSGAKKSRLSNNTTNQDLEASIELQTTNLETVQMILKNYPNFKDLLDFLVMNDSKVPTLFEEIINRCADFITFGAIQKCEVCAQGNLMFAKHGYECDGNFDEWSKCNNFLKTPKRILAVFPLPLQEALLAKNIQLKVRDRAVRPKGETIDRKREVKVMRQREPLYDMHVVFVGLAKSDETELKTRVQSMGGKTKETKPLKETAVAISTIEIMQKNMNKKMKEVQKLEIQVVDKSFLDSIAGFSPAETISAIRQMEISNWGSDPNTRIPQENSTTELKVSFMSKRRFICSLYHYLNISFCRNQSMLEEPKRRMMLD